MLLLWLMAATLTGLLNTLDLAAELWLLAIGVPITALANAHESLLIGRGQYRERAVARSSRWLARLPLIVIRVALGLSVWG
jgi:hypothetical protein